MKRVFGIIEAVFDLFYLGAVMAISIFLLVSASAGSARMLAGIMGLVLIIGDSFHLIPRIRVILTTKEQELRRALGIGKQITSITMTFFYLLLWQIGLVIFSKQPSIFWSYLIYVLAAVRVLLCLLPHNRWQERYPPVSWGIIRNIPFIIQGSMVAGLYLTYRTEIAGLGLMWLAIILSFIFYIPVVLLANKNPKIGMLMLPKTCAYIWMMIMCLSL